MYTDALQRLLSTESWRSVFSDVSFARGVQYARGGRVLAISHETRDADVDVLLAQVEGNADEPYHVEVTIDRRRDKVHLATRCSCPIGSLCKHAAAVLVTAARQSLTEWPSEKARGAGVPLPLRALPRVDPARVAMQRPLPPPQDPALRAWDTWLQHWSVQGQPVPIVAESGRRFGVLIGRSSELRGARLRACPVWLRPGKVRGLVDPQPLSLRARFGPQPQPPQGWSEDEATALTLLLQDALERVGNLAYSPIETPALENALLRLAAQHPVYFEKAANGEFSRGETLPLRLHWNDHADGTQRLACSVEGDPTVLLLRGARLWYVQPQQRRYGLVDGDTALYDLAHEAPPLPPERVAGLQQALHEYAPRLALPTPAPRGAVQMLEAVPEPVLRLGVVHGNGAFGSRRSRGETPYGMAQLLFDYAGHRLGASDGAARPRRLVRGTVLQIQRDLQREQEVIQSLLAHGLMHASRLAWQFGLDPRRVDGWHFLLWPNQRRPPAAPDQWNETLEALRSEGIRIEYEPGAEPEILVPVGEWHADLKSGENAWFDVSLGIDVDGERIDLAALLRGLLADTRFPLQPRKGEAADATWRLALDERRRIELPLARLRALIEPLMDWLLSDTRNSAMRLHRSQAEQLLRASDQARMAWRGDLALRDRLTALRQRVSASDAPPGFRATLRDYQREGLAWLGFLADAGLGGVLADDMGLGKTVQVLAHVLAEKQRGKLVQPALVIAPTSLVGNWRDEAARFAPDLRVLVLHGAQRGDRYDEINAHDLVITTYPLLSRDRERLLEQRFALLILDEAQAIKNSRSQAAQVVRELHATRRLAMTGTPLENHLGELWAQFDAVEPGLLGGEREFNRLYRTPIEKHGDIERQQRLNRRIGALLLRRRKEDVLGELPPKTEILRRLELDGAQRELYETLRSSQELRVQEAVRERGLAQSGIVVLDALLKLRQVCCDPRLVKLPAARKVRDSAKLDALLELLDGLLAEGRKVLLFSQFTGMLDLIEAALAPRDITYLRLTGETPGAARAGLVKRFQDGAAPLFLISLKAGGVGLNLTAADTVIHYDPWWNPAVEAQATDRAHRIGQDKPVFVYRLVCAGTVEEKIQALQARKAELARAVLEGGSTTRVRFDESDLAELFAPLA